MIQPRRRKTGELYLCFTRSKSAEEIHLCLNRKSKSQRRGSSSLILQSSTTALLFMPPAQFKSASPRTSRRPDNSVSAKPDRSLKLRFKDDLRVRKSQINWIYGTKPEAAMTQARLPTEFPISTVGFFTTSSKKSRIN